MRNIDVMNLEDAAKELGISVRSFYRLINEGLVLYSLQPVNRPRLAYHVDRNYIAEVKGRLAATRRKHKRVATIRAILQQLRLGG